MCDKMLSHIRMGVPYEYTHMGRPICTLANIHIWDRTDEPVKRKYEVLKEDSMSSSGKILMTMHQVVVTEMRGIHQQKRKG